MKRRGSLVFALTCVVVGLAITAATEARAQDCESMSGPARTDCFIGRARILGNRSGIAAGAARQRADEERLRAVTGTSGVRKPHRAKPTDRVPVRPKAERNSR